MNTQNLTYLLFTALLFLCFGTLHAEGIPGLQQKASAQFRTADACVPPSAREQLDINNVRCLLFNGGDMWWDLVGNPRYEIPKGSGRHSLFAASLWIGGTDASGQMRVAAQTYRQDGYDFWPGPLVQGTASVDDAICSKWNKMFKITKAEIEGFRAAYELSKTSGIGVDMALYPNVATWPAFGKDAEGQNVTADMNGKTIYMAPFEDVDGDLDYKPADGDYPKIRGDQAVWWIINDKGNVHTATGAEPIGVELHIMAFAFTAANAINNMTFYDQIVINRSSLTLNQTYMGQWIDADLGYFKDDYVGCDTTRGLGICYNSDNDDSGNNGYGTNPPAVGVDFFKGPLADIGDGLDNNKNGIVDEDGETIIMSKFVYYNNDFSLKGNPETGVHYYNYLRGIWKDGTPMVDNGKDAYSATAPGSSTNYIFPGSVCNQTGWIEGTAAGTAPDDRRLLQSAGPFTLNPGAVNQVITGVVWARGSSNLNSVCELLSADDVAQALFDNDFRLLEGPDAPEVAVGEYDSKVVLTWGFTPGTEAITNNYNESYVQADPVLKAQGNPDSLFNFQGYMVYQLADNTVELSDLTNPEKAQLIAQCDIIDNVTSIANRVETILNDGVGLPVTVIEDALMVTGANKGIFHSLEVTQDLFAQGSFKGLSNYTPYYFAVVAYAYNNETSDGRMFVLGNGKFARAKVKALPHDVASENAGTEIQCDYGDGVELTQIGGYGNGGYFTRLTEACANSIVSNYSTNTLSFQESFAPINVKVVNPKEVQKMDYKVVLEKNLLGSDTLTLTATDTIIESTYTDWVLYNKANNTKIFESTYRLRNDGSAPRPAPLRGNEIVIPGHGISITVKDVIQAGTDSTIIDNGIVGSEIVFSDASKAWLTGLADVDVAPTDPWNWMLIGPKRASGVGSENTHNYPSVFLYDKYQPFEKIVGGTWCPFPFAREFVNATGAGNYVTPGVRLGLADTSTGTANSILSLDAREAIDLNELTDIDVVFTADKSKWSRCVVVETSPTSIIGSGAWNLSGKWKANVDKDGTPAPAGPQKDNHGLGWFPGYAINVSTGQRMCVFFGESEWDHQNRGDDMMFNPTSSVGPLLDRVGGRHYVYVTDLPYLGETGGGVDTLKKYLLNETLNGIGGFATALAFEDIQPAGDTLIVDMEGVYKHVSWTCVAMANAGYDAQIAKPSDFPSDARVSIRLNQTYHPNKFNSTAAANVPTFEFSTSGKEVRTGLTDIAKNALDQILIVPNPYYGYSDYENGQLESTVKITNLPQVCTVKIFSMNGNLVKTFFKDSDTPEQAWDMKNQSGVPVASGIYIIHVNAPGIGEKTIKMIAIMRQLDLNSF